MSEIQSMQRGQATRGFEQRPGATRGKSLFIGRVGGSAAVGAQGAYLACGLSCVQWRAWGYLIGASIRLL